MDVTDRFARWWERWDEKVHERSDIPAFLAGASDEDLVELLAAASAQERKYERDVVATEILNRLSRRQRDLPAAAQAVLASAHDAYEAAAEGQQAIHIAETILKANGDKDLGVAVSASAYASLDTTRLAFEAAQRNSADVAATVAQSRVADRLAHDAAATARRGSDATREATDTLVESGHAREAEAARKAAARIEAAAHATSAAAQNEQESEGTAK